jgi:hypothetical protein
VRIEIRLELEGVSDLGHRVEELHDFDGLCERLLGKPGQATARTF